MRKMQIKEEYKGKTVIVYNSVLGNQNVIIDKILPKHYDWYSRNGLGHIFEAESTIMNARELELQNELEADTFAMAQLSGVKAPEQVPVVKKTRTKKK